MSIPAHLLVHTAQIEPYIGSGAYGDQYGQPLEVPCYYEGKRQLVRAGDGSETVSEGTVYIDPCDVPAGSRVTVMGRETWVITVSVFDDGDPLGMSHVELALA